MYTIGEISKIVKISIDALRHYDEIGLLKPHFFDPSSRYRYYTADQVNEVFMIMEWKQYGFSLDAIRELMKCSDHARLRDHRRTYDHETVSSLLAASRLGSLAEPLSQELLDDLLVQCTRRDQAGNGISALDVAAHAE